MIKKVKFNKKAKQKIVTFTINEKIHPFDRDERYESNIEKFLSKNKYGEIVNIGTLQFANGEIEFFDISILIYNNFDFKKVINELIYKFEEFHSYQILLFRLPIHVDHVLSREGQDIQSHS